MDDFLYNIPPLSFSTSAVILADILVDGLTVDEQNTIANWFDLVAQTIITNAGQQQLIANRNQNNNNNNNEYDNQIRG